MVVATMARRHKVVPGSTLGILAFDAGKTMCRLISLYHSLSDDQITKLRNEVITSKGVSYLNSQQECFLLNLAAAERLEELDDVAAIVSRLGQKCSDLSLTRFDHVYADLKLGIMHLRKLNYNTRSTQKIISKMEKLVSSTANLYTAMESMAELEASEKKRQRWKTMRPTHNYYNNHPKPDLEYFNEIIENQRKQVQHYKEVSSWNQTFDNTVGIMAKVVSIVYARICSVFGAYITGNFNSNNNTSNIISSFNDNCDYCLIEYRELYQKNRYLEESLRKRVSMSGPIAKGKNSDSLSSLQQRSLSSRDLMKRSIIGQEWPDELAVGEDPNSKNNEKDKNKNIVRLAPSSTVGGAGLSARYADVILLAERCLHAPETVGEGAREALYEMLPERLRQKLRAKLRGRWAKEEKYGEDGKLLAEGWRDAVEELMEWLVPVARDTVRWQTERHFEKARFETKTTTLLLQTLHYSDLEKAETAIVEVLVGLSCIYWYERRR